MMAEYEFVETSSRNITENGQQLRVVNFRGTDQSSVPNEKLNVDGSFTMPLTEYFQAGVDGELPNKIKEYVVGRLQAE
ncbi:hypothetical protein AXY_02260 [Amphibacillus xylanus NBRC 15112]|uniref:Uncharacterized protein n=2 Tax=Amphibacillus xylanus TaxID=1449 RepID=K0J5V5_AMPXN|nr:hypothetical protein AXY_02260 [Amphibacillus xylanus NBRC 15112]